MGTSAIQPKLKMYVKKSQIPGISVMTPTASPAKKAPDTLPKPPNATIAKAIMVNNSPMKGLTDQKLTRSAPAIVTVPPPIPHARAFILSVEMPMYRAAWGFKDVAVRALPIFVRFITNHTAQKAITERAAAASLVAGAMTPIPILKLLPTKMP